MTPTEAYTANLRALAELATPTGDDSALTRYQGWTDPPGALFVCIGWPDHSRGVVGDTFAKLRPCGGAGTRGRVGNAQSRRKP